LLDIEPALSALAEAIARFAETRLAKEVRSFGDPRPPFLKPYSDSLMRKGWCRFVVASAEIAVSPSFLRLIDAAGFTTRSDGHQRCTREYCLRNQIDKVTYTQRHKPERCRCAFRKPDFDTVVDILDSGYIPVVRFKEEDESLQLGGIHPDVKNSHYIAFSHVWADGLGSCTEVGLPICQLRRLRSLAKQRTKDGAWFWTDGLCVPRLEPYRGQAIELMKLTYQNAVGVIVLDSGLGSLSSQISPLELGWCIFASGWFGRLWTYEEGFLPQWVNIELKDGLIDFYQVIQKLYQIHMNDKDKWFAAIFIRDLLTILQKARPLDRFNRQRPMSRRVVDLFNALSRRRSSRPDDQLLVMGLLLDIDIKPLLSLEGEEKWIFFYRNLKHIQWTVLFDQREKLRTSPFRWAPSTWISPGRDEWLHYDEAPGEITDEGLKVTLTVLTVPTTALEKLSQAFIHVGSDFYEISREPEGPGSKINQFNVIIVRHFSGETPAAALERNMSILFRVGLAISGNLPRDLVYDFTGSWEIRKVENMEDEDTEGVLMIDGEWKYVDLTFT
jgi:hypothetical protein